MRACLKQPCIHRERLSPCAFSLAAQVKPLAHYYAHSRAFVRRVFGTHAQGQARAAGS